MWLTYKLAASYSAASTLQLLQSVFKNAHAIVL